MVERAVRRVELGLEENAAIGDRFKRGGAFIRKPEPNKELQKNKTKHQNW